MCKFNFINGLYSFFIVFSMTVKCSRRYDINEEAKTLFHTDIPTILQMFRRTPEYLKILDDKRNAIEDTMRDAKMYLNYVQLKKLDERIQDMFDLRTTTTSSHKQSTTSHNSSSAMFLFRSALMRRQNEPEPEPGVKVLDEYSIKVASSKLTPKERQHAKNLGFEYTGKIIHEIIKTLGKDSDGPYQPQHYSTEKDQKATKITTSTTTTEHLHVVTSTTESTIETLSTHLGNNYSDSASNFTITTPAIVSKATLPAGRGR